MFLASADLHLRDDTPVCRTDDYQATQHRKLGFLFDAARTMRVPVLIAGDIFDHWKPSHKLMANIIEMSEGLSIVVVPGQHDLPNHSLDLLDKSGLAVLRASGWLVLNRGLHFTTPQGIVIAGYAFGEDPPKSLKSDVLIWHRMTWTYAIPYPGCTEPHANQLLKRYPNVHLIITGDNHRFFTATQGSSTLLNPGSMTRATADQGSHKPRFYAVNDNLTCTAILFPIEPDVISDVHLVREREHDAKLEAFVSRIAKDSEMSLSFEANMDRFLEANKTIPPVRQAVMTAMEKEN